MMSCSTLNLSKILILNFPSLQFVVIFSSMSTHVRSVTLLFRLNRTCDTPGGTLRRRCDFFPNQIANLAREQHSLLKTVRNGVPTIIVNIFCLNISVFYSKSSSRSKMSFTCLFNRMSCPCGEGAIFFETNNRFC